MLADTIFHNGRVITMSGEGDVFTAFAVWKNRFLAVGTDSDIRRFHNAGSKVIDLDGAAVIPGFIETHTHASVYAMNLMQVDCSSPPNRTIEDIKSGIREKARVTPPGEWIRGFGFDDTLIGDKRHLTRRDLDEVAPDHPVQIMHISVHFSYVNTLGLRIAGVGADTPQPKGGEIDRDGDGAPSGLMIEAGAMDLVRRHIPPFSADQIKDALKKSFGYFHRAGVTSIHDGGVGYFQHGRQVIDAYQSLAREGNLKLRTTLTLVEELYQTLVDLGFRTTFGDSFLKLGSVKTWQDGSIQGLTGALEEPYHTRPDLTGELLLPQETLDAMVEKYHCAGMQIAVHANGDRAVESVLRAYEKAYEKQPLSRRHMIIHCQTASNDHIRRMKAIGVIPNYFVNHVYYWGDRHESIFLGPRRAARLDPLASTLAAGLEFCLHSDLPVTPVDPMSSIHTAVNRTTRLGKVLGPGERVPVEAALAAYTTTAAKAGFVEHEAGAVKPGYLADFVVLSSDPLAVLPQEIKNVRPMQTWLDGKCVFSVDD